ncbi:MAG TPA: hypothetical protein PLB41_01380 [Rubrivivax sp.]|nr:hypothetical protein [Rubrivivax sp.]
MGISMPQSSLRGLLALTGAAAALCSQAQTLKAPQAQAWIDVATFSGLGLPGGAMAGASPMAMMGAMMGGGAAANSFGQTQTGAAGRWVDVTLSTRANAQLTEAQQAVPAGFMSSALQLRAPQDGRAAPPDDDKVVEQPTERPQGRLLLYWGCGATVRPGQPKVLDMASASAADLANFFAARRATQRGAHSAAGRPVWPNPADARLLPQQASLVGEHAFSGAGVPPGFRFQIPPAQDLMPPLQLQTGDAAGATELRWNAIASARAYFAAGMGARGDHEMVIWTSSELPDSGMGLVDYQTNPAVDRWLREKVLLAPGITQCTVPRGVFAGEGAMLRVIAYGNELNLAHPPRPADPKADWAPLWAVKLRVKSVATVMPGMGEMPQMPAGSRDAPAPGQPAQGGDDKPGDLLPKAGELLRGIFR